MGWQSDWLFQLIFDEITLLRSKARQEAQGELGPPPRYFVIQQCANADWNGIVACLDPVISQWRFDESGLQVMDISSELPSQTIPKQGMFFDVGIVRFCVASDRKHVTMTYILGPRYAAGNVFVVLGQGKTGKLSPSVEHRRWIS
jgi:hypothetical protein